MLKFFALFLKYIFNGQYKPAPSSAYIPEVVRNKATWLVKQKLFIIIFVSFFHHHHSSQKNQKFLQNLFSKKHPYDLIKTKFFIKIIYFLLAHILLFLIFFSLYFYTLYTFIFFIHSILATLLRSLCQLLFYSYNFSSTIMLLYFFTSFSYCLTIQILILPFS